MEHDEARPFLVSGEAYDSFMGRYSIPLAQRFADVAGVTNGRIGLDVGCGPGALTAVLVERLGADRVRACDPSPSFVAACIERHPGVDVRAGTAESLPFDDDSCDVALAQLVLHFVSDVDAATRELRRVVRAGGTIGASVWEFERGMEMLRLFWDAAVAVDPEAPDEAQTMRFGRSGEIAELFDDAGLVDVEEHLLSVASRYADFDELWRSLLAGVGPAGTYCVSLTDERRGRLRQELLDRLGHPTGAFTLSATAVSAVGAVPG